MSHKPNQAQIMAAAAELLHRRKCLEDLDYWATHAAKDFTLPGFDAYTPARHHLLLLDYLKRVDSGEIKRLMVFMPPGSAKSTYTGPIFTSWFMAKHPRSLVISTSAASNLALDLSRKTQNLIKRHSLALSMMPVQENAEYWACSNGSSYLSSSIGANVTGFRGTLVIIDDPVKNFEEAMSEIKRESTYQWYTTVLATRLIPHAPIIVIQTRWHQDDLSGRLLADQGNVKEGGLWHVLSLPAVWNEDTPDELGRNRGDLLWQDWQDAIFIEEKRKELGLRNFAALFQQSPRSEEGSLFKTQHVKYESISPKKDGDYIRAWDLAATKKEGSRDPDFTVGVLMNRRPDDSIWVMDVVRFREGPEKVREIIKNTAMKDGTNIKISLPQDPGAAGKYVINDLTKMLIGWNVEGSPESGEKATRAMPFAAQVNAGNVHIMKRHWTDVYVDELQGFPGLPHDDCVDASSRAMAGLTKLGRGIRMVDCNFMKR